MEQQLINPEQELQNFERHLILQSSLQPITINAHLKCITRLFRIIKTTSPSDNQIENFVFELRQSSYSCSHISNNIVSIEKWSASCDRNLTFAKPKKPKRLIKDFLTEAEVSRIISASKNIREKGILSLLAYTGLRNRELCSLKVSDLDFGDNLVRVIKGKNCKDRVINMAGECTKILIKYLNEFPRSEDDFLFTTLRLNNQYSSGALRKLVKVVAKRAGINRRVFVHIFRTSLASNLLKRGAGILTIKEQLGHSDLSSTLIYLQSCPQRAKSEYDYYKPAYI